MEPSQRPTRFVPDKGDMNVGDRAEEFVSIRVLGRERLPAMPVAFFWIESAKSLFSRPLDNDESFVCFFRRRSPNVFLCKRPPHITGRGVSAVCTEGGSEPPTSSPRSDFTTLSLISPNAVRHSLWSRRNLAASNSVFVLVFLVGILPNNPPGILFFSPQDGKFPQ